MKKTLILIATLASHTLCAGVPSPQDLVGAIENAIANKDAKAIETLTYTEGMSEEDKARNFRHIPDQLFTTPTQKVEIGDLSADQVKPFRIHRGLKFIPTAQPVGSVLLHQKSDKFSSTARLSYAKVNDLYYLVGVKSEKLNWDGPPDKSIGWMIGGPSANTRDYRYTYYASGIMISDSSEYASSSFSGQYIAEVTFTSDSDDFEGEIIINEAGKEVARSEKFKGKGTFTYKRKE
jgi:hypothetical protein